MKKVLLLIFLFFISTPVAFAKISKDDFFKLLKTGTPEQVQQSINDGFDVNTKMKKTPTNTASYFFNGNLIVTNIIPVDTPYYGKTPLIYAAGFSNNPDIIKTLIKNGANIEEKDDLSTTPLMLAVANNKNIEVIKVLVDNNANVDEISSNGLSPFYYAAAFSPPQVISLLEKKSSNVDSCKFIRYKLINPYFIKLKSMPNSEYWSLIDKYKENCLGQCSEGGRIGIIGYTKDALIEDKGIPSKIFKLNENTELISYSESNKKWVEGTWSGGPYYQSGTEGHWEGNDYEDIYTLDKGIVTSFKRNYK